MHSTACQQEDTRPKSPWPTHRGVFSSVAIHVIYANSKNKDFFHKNAASYVKEIEKLDSEIKNVIEHSKRKEIIVADRFPFLYFCREYGLKYYAAFPGCSKDTDASAKTASSVAENILIFFALI